MPMDFVRIALEGTPKCQPNSSVWNAGATCDCTGADFPCIDEPATVSISSLTVSAAFRRGLGRPLRGLSSKQPVASKSFSPQLHLSTDLYPFESPSYGDRNVTLH
ncbi:hypothetical protein TNCV_4327671 [Trichonephila clavipes]|nr:hypothetical protein TNCV_4327671 [Trichonephila clavipes]